ncbi:MAG: trypsin-like peptidase domain-containing protein [Patescibacteria group bacterium]
MICKTCGKETKDGNKFCNYCGESFSDKPSTEIKEKEIKVTLNKSLLLKIVVGVVGLLILYIIFSDRPFSFLSDDREIDQRVLASSVVNVLCESGEDEVSGGSGTMITIEGIVLTNSHVIPQNNENILTTDEGCLVILPNQQTGQPEEMYWARPIVIPELSDEYDLAYLEIYDAFVDEDGEVRGRYPRTFQSIFADENKHDDICQFRKNKLGDPIRIFGYPQTSGGFYLTITDGVISSFSDEGVILTSAKIDEGNSGGLAVDQKGCMVGIPVAVSEGKYQNLGVIISTDLILEFSDKLDTILNEQ